jgi:hypothetical protein
LCQRQLLARCKGDAPFRGARRAFAVERQHANHLALRGQRHAQISRMRMVRRRPLHVLAHESAAGAGEGIGLAAAQRPAVFRSEHRLGEQRMLTPVRADHSDVLRWIDQGQASAKAGQQIVKRPAESGADLIEFTAALQHLAKLAQLLHAFADAARLGECFGELPVCIAQFVVTARAASHGRDDECIRDREKHQAEHDRDAGQRLRQCRHVVGIDAALAQQVVFLVEHDARGAANGVDAEVGHCRRHGAGYAPRLDCSDRQVTLMQHAVCERVDVRDLHWVVLHQVRQLAEIVVEQRQLAVEARLPQIVAGRGIADRICLHGTQASEDLGHLAFDFIAARDPVAVADEAIDGSPDAKTDCTEDRRQRQEQQ